MPLQPYENIQPVPGQRGPIVVRYAPPAPAAAPAVPDFTAPAVAPPAAPSIGAIPDVMAGPSAYPTWGSWLSDWNRAKSQSEQRKQAWLAATNAWGREAAALQEFASMAQQNADIEQAQAAVEQARRHIASRMLGADVAAGVPLERAALAHPEVFMDSAAGAQALGRIGAAGIVGAGAPPPFTPSPAVVVDPLTGQPTSLVKMTPDRYERLGPAPARQELSVTDRMNALGGRVRLKQAELQAINAGLRDNPDNTALTSARVLALNDLAALQDEYVKLGAPTAVPPGAPAPGTREAAAAATRRYFYDEATGSMRR